MRQAQGISARNQWGSCGPRAPLTIWGRPPCAVTLGHCPLLTSRHLLPPHPVGPPCSDRETEELCLWTVGTWEQGFVFERSPPEACVPAPREAGMTAGRPDCTFPQGLSPTLPSPGPAAKPRPLSGCQLPPATSLALLWSLPQPVCLCHFHQIGPSAPFSVHDDFFVGHSSAYCVYFGSLHSHVQNTSLPTLFAQTVKCPGWPQGL